MKILEKHAWSLINIPYSWGGDDATGFDCSGLVLELLQGCGVIRHKFDTTAQGLYNMFDSKGVHNSKGFGALVFFGKSKIRITHVGFMLDNFRMLEAGGGGSHIKTLEDAIKYNAFTRIRPIDIRSDLVAIIKPRYPLFY